MFGKIYKNYSIFFLCFLLSARTALGSEEAPTEEMLDSNQAQEFMSAVLNGALHEMRSILDACPSDVCVELVNLDNELFGTPLHAAVQNRCSKSVYFLIQRGARAQATNNRKETPLHDVAGNGDTKLARLLIQNGADVRSKDISGKTPLHLAAAAQHFEVAQLLIENGADVNCETVSGETPLRLLLEDFASNRSSDEIQNCLNIAILFVLHGAKISAETVNQFTQFFPGHADWFRFVFAWQCSGNLCALPRDLRNFLRQFVTKIQRAEIRR